ELLEHPLDGVGRLQRAARGILVLHLQLVTVDAALQLLERKIDAFLAHHAEIRARSRDRHQHADADDLVLRLYRQHERADEREQCQPQKFVHRSPPPGCRATVQRFYVRENEFGSDPELRVGLTGAFRYRTLRSMTCLRVARLAVHYAAP